eukprot:TRINITY_DN56724_c0_g1_i1.p1 TRINITY_DN56724_c0_g1~~TRINITY_DN56724_c0_g1_i1.p1  ORF type:complete len:373 (+),score=32.92 TRINITY_DN56724_c0_g1_i1:100-1218(+)
MHYSWTSCLACFLLTGTLQLSVLAILLVDDGDITTIAALGNTTTPSVPSATTTANAAVLTTTEAASLAGITTESSALAANAGTTTEGLAASAPKAVCPPRSEEAQFLCSPENRALCHEADSGPDQHCTRNDERCVWEVNSAGPFIPCCEKRLMFELFVWFRDLILKHGPENPDFWYIPVYGSLLAMYRNCDLIDHDTDIDITVPYDQMDWLDKILQENVNSVSPSYSWSGKGDTMSRIFLSDINGAHIDIWYALNGTAAGPNGTFSIMMTEDYEGHNDGLESSWVFPIADVDSRECCLQHECFPCPAKTTDLLDKWWPFGWGSPDYTKGDPALFDSSVKSAGTAEAITDTLPTFMLEKALRSNFTVRRLVLH